MKPTLLFTLLVLSPLFSLSDTNLAFDHAGNNISMLSTERVYAPSSKAPIAPQPFTSVSPAFRETKLIAGDGELGDEFGRAIAVQGDLAVVGSPYDSVAGYGSGSAYVFARTSPGWALQQKLTAIDGSPYSFFGSSLAIDGNTVVVGAYGDQNAGNYAGAAYVFVRSGSTWNQEQKLSGSENSVADGFGLSVAIKGDTIVCGAFGDSDLNMSEVGSAYVFGRTGNGWVQRQKLSASDAMSLNRFGLSVAISEDTIVIGADGNSEFGFYSGAVYVFTFDGSNWIERQKLHARDTSEGASFGYPVAISGGTIVAGAPGDDGVGRHTRGAAYVFGRRPAGWSQQRKLFAVDSDAFDGFGLSVAVSGGTIVVGNPGDPDAAFNAGSAYVYKREGQAGWSLRKKLLASDAARDDNFGCAVAVGDNTVAIGAYARSDVAPYAGAAYAFAF
jgi:hypothetical protein